MSPIRASLLFASLSLVAACGASADKAAEASAVATTPTPSVAAAAAAPVVAALSEAEVRAVVDAAETASKNMDVDAAMATLSDDVTFTMVPPAASGAATHSMNRDEIAAEFRKTAKEASDRGYSSQVGNVRIADDGASAAVDVAVTEQMKYQGHKIVSLSDQTYTVASRQGKAKIVAMTTKMTGLTVDDVKRF